MRESFVFHAEFIDDLPEEYRLQFMTYAVNYGIYGIEPEVNGLESALWKKIKRRIDADTEAYTQKKAARSAAGKKHKGNQYTRQKEQEAQKEAERNEEESEKTGVENGAEAEKRNEEETLSVSKPQTQMAKQIHEIFSSNNLPCSPIINFLGGEFKRGLSHIHRSLAEYRISSDDLIKACENYASVVNDKDDFYDTRLPFDRFVESPKFLDFLPSAFVKENWRKWEVKKKEAETEKKDEEDEGFLPWTDICPECRKKELRWSNKLSIHKCFACQRTFDFQTVDDFKERMRNGTDKR